MTLHSIRWRFQVWYGLLLCVVLAGFAVTVFQLERTRRLRDIDFQLRLRSDALARSVPLNRPPPHGPDDGFEEDPSVAPPNHDVPAFRLPPESEALFATNSGIQYYYIIYGWDLRLVYRSDHAPGTHGTDYDGKSAHSLRGIAGPGRVTPRPNRLAQTPVGVGRSCREFEHQMPMGEVCIVGCDTSPVLEELRAFGWSIAGIAGIVLACGLTGGWWLASRAIRPIDAITSAAIRISAGDISQRVDIEETESELGRLATVLNSTFGRLEAAFATQAQFTADAAHELRTPVAVILAQTQMALKQDRTPDEYRETVAACLRSAQKMRGLIESLLKLARLDAGQEIMTRQKFDLTRLVRDCAEHIKPLAAERGVQVDLDTVAGEAIGDASRLDQVITNLLTNAIQYNRPGGQVRVTVSQKNGSTTLAVADNGLGISEADLPHVFERFYRADKARTKAEGRTGLGLSICKAIVAAQGGTIEVSSKLGVGSTFTLRLPSSPG